MIQPPVTTTPLRPIILPHPPMHGIAPGGCIPPNERITNPIDGGGIVPVLPQPAAGVATLGLARKGDDWCGTKPPAADQD